MANYIIGSQAWFDYARRRVVDIGKKLADGNITVDERDRLYNEHTRLVIELFDNWNADLVNNPIN